jgi:MFS family permease
MGLAVDKENEERSPVETSPVTEKEAGEKTAPTTPSENDTAKEAGSALAPPLKDDNDLSDFTSATGVDEEKAPQPEQEVPPRDIEGWRWLTVVFAILSSTFLFALDNTIVADVQPVIVEHFDSVSKLSWLSVAFLIGAAATNLVWGKIYGQFNAKWTYIFCVALFEVGSAICGAAPTMDALIVGRAICGVGGSGTYVGVMTLLAATTTIHERPMYVGGTGLTWGLGTVLGPIIGGAFTDSSAGWRWSFYINLCIGAVCAPVYVFLLPNKDPRPGVSLLDRAREVDYVGMILTIGAFVSGVMAVSFGGVTYPWNSGRIIGLFCCSGVLFILLGIQQVYTIFTTTSRRIFPVEFFKNKTVLILFAMTSAGGTAIFIPIYMIPIFFQFTKSDSALESGVRLLPYIFLMVFAVIANGAILSAYGYYMPWYTMGGILVVIGGALMYTVDDMTGVSRVYGYTVIIGFGVGLFGQASFSVAQAVVEDHMIPSAVGFITCAQISGVTIALAIANSVFLNKSQSGIQAILPGVPTAEIQQAIAGAGSQFFYNLSGTVRQEVLAAIISAMSKTYILVITAGSLVIVLSMFMKRERLFMAAGGAA